MVKDRAALDEIRARLSLTDVVGEVVALKRAGGTWKGLCPFHSEKTPSFNVSNERGFYKCFGCGESGDIFTFVMKTRGIDFAEALRELADRAGVKLERRSDGRGSTPREAVLAMHQTALEFFRSTLASHTVARQYLADRGIDVAAIDQFRIGLAPDSWDALLKRFGGKYPKDVLTQSGLFRENSSGGLYDLFRNRIIFPIFDTASRPIAFGAREYLGEKDAPKYINSPESAIYVKGRNLYGIDLAKDAIKRADEAILVEGYTDVIAAHRAGFSNTVAALGTALTAEQVTILSRFGSKITLVYDPDVAGRSATERGIDVALDRGLTVRVASLPDGLDPADAIRERGAEEFGRAIAAARDFIEYRIDQKLATAATAIERGQAARDLAKSLSHLTDNIVRGAITRRIAERFGVSESSLASPAPAQELRKVVRGLDAELSLLRLMMDHPGLAARARNDLIGDDFSSEAKRKVFDLLVSDSKDRAAGPALELMAHIAVSPAPDGAPEKLYADYVRTMRARRLDAEIHDCTVNLRRPDLGDAERNAIMSRLMMLTKEKSAAVR